MRSLHLSKTVALLFCSLTAIAVALVLGVTSARATTTPTVLSVSVPADGSYKAGQHLDFTVTYDQAVDVLGTPQIALTIGSSIVHADYMSGSSTAALVFRYTVQAGDNDSNGIAVGALGLNGGSIVADADGTTVADLTLNSVGSTANVDVDTTAPTASSINRASSSPTNASSVDFTVTFSEAVSGVDASDFGTTVTGSASAAVSAVTPVSSSVYTVTVSPVAGDGTVRLDLNASGTGIADTAGNAISGGHNGDQTYTVDNTAPTVAGVSVPSNGSYKAGQNLDFTVTYSENVTVTGTPQIGLTIGSGSVNASYVSGTGTTALVFRYTVQAGDNDSNGIAVGTLSLNGGTLKDAAGNNADLTLNSVGSTTAVLVDTTAPTVTSVSVPTAGTYGAGQNLDFTVHLSENVTVTGTPQIALTIGSGSKNAAYVSGSGTNALVFRYTVQAGDSDSDGIGVGALGLNGGSIADTAGNAANTTLNSVGSTTSVLVAATAPTVTAVSAPTAGSYKAGTTLDFTVHFSSAVTVTTTGGTPSLALTIGSASKNAAYVSGSGTTSIVFRYTVQAGDSDTDGVQVGTLSLNGGTIKDGGGNDAVLTLNNVSATTAVLVDTTVPTLASVVGPTAGTYTSGQNLDFTVTFSEKVTVSGNPRLTLTIGSQTAYATYLSGSGTTALVFRYVVLSGDSDSNGIQLGSAIDLNSGTIADAAGNAPTALTFPTVPDLTKVLVGGASTTQPGGTTPGGADKTPPTKPATVKASVKNGRLFVTFSKATDNGTVVGYEIIIGGKVVQTIKSTSFLLSAASIMPAKAKSLVIDVEAIDAAGNKSVPFKVTLRRLATPKGTPKVVPAWARQLAKWQAVPARKRGKRPHTPKHLPGWYAKWVSWQKNPFAVSVG